MSESEVSQIRDEDVLRRMWQQTEDFGRKKEIRAHMYKLREERLRDLYSPEPLQGKGCEFSAAHAQGHGQSFADQTFQSMKSKEVRDASSPPKEFSYRGQDLKELSNAGWNVESEDRTTDDGRTHVKLVNANIEGRYDVEGGQGQFAAADRQRRAVTEHHDARSSLRRDEANTETAAREHVVRQTDDGARISSTTTSSNTSSQVNQVSSTTRDVPFEDDYDRRRIRDVDRNERVTTITNDDYDRNLRTTDSSTLRKIDTSTAELVSRKVEYPDDNTKVIVETRLLPDGTRVTSTRREFRAPAQSSRSEHRSSQSKTYSSQHTSDHRDSSSKTRHTIENRSNDIVDSQRNVDDYDFKRQLREYTSHDNDDSTTRQHHVTKTNRKVTDDTQTNDEFSQKRYETRVQRKVTDQDLSTTNKNEHRRRTDVDHSTTSRDDYTQKQQRMDRQTDYEIDNTDRRHTTTTRDHDIQHKIVKETQHVTDSEERVHNISRHRKDNEEVIHNIQRDRMIPDDGVRDIPRGSVPVDKEQRVPKNNVPDTDSYRNVQRTITVSVDKTRDTPQSETVPVERYRDVPKDVSAPKDKPRDIPKETISTNEIVIRKKDTQSEDVVKKNTSTEQYQTTYQNDYQSRKVSTDWSPTHQAWASTLRSDTPSTTRPSTRASSPGSKTFKSSTSSLRSSVSPDKSSRKPSSRGGSPNKFDRFSPTRTVTSDRYSSTHSTQTVTEEKIKKNTSPERKPPTGRSPTRPGYSPDRKPQDGFRQRPSVSPEKRPKNISDRPYTSPDRKTNDKNPTVTSFLDEKVSPSSPTESRKSPERRPTYPPSDDYPSDSYPSRSPYRSTSGPEKRPFENKDHPSPKSRQSPDRRPGYEKPGTTDHPRPSSPSKPRNPTAESPRQFDSSPDRKQRPHQKPTQSKQPPNKPEDKTVKSSSTSPDRKPGFMRPTASSEPDEKTKQPLKPENEHHRKSPSKQINKPDEKPNEIYKTSKIKEDHYRFVDEETKVYSHRDTINVEKVLNTPTVDDTRPRDRSPYQVKNMPSEDSPDYCTSRPEPREYFDKDNTKPTTKITKDRVVTTATGEFYDTVDQTIVTTNITSNQQTDENITNKRVSKIDYPDRKDSPNRETSPTKYGTYDKKKSREEVDTTVVTTVTRDDTKDIKIDSVTRRDKTSPMKIPDTPTLPGKKTPRDNVSPTKSPIKDTKYKNTTDFIASERKITDEVNKKVTKDRPRKLVTPSSSPTRKPMPTEAEPSTGQSSPTTSVSGFVYFGSPRTEKPEVTDLDEFYPTSNIPQKTTKSPDDLKNTEEYTKRPETIDVKRSPSPSKIPCRSPSPEKHIPTTKESLPRKSSLKKPTTEFNQASPVEKPPTSFRVSPTEDKTEEIGNKVVKKDRPDEPETNEPETGEPKFSEKPKPPLQRRETYDDRCKKILGLVDDTTETTRETRKYTRKSDSTQNSPSVSPCDSPAPNESAPFSTYTTTKKTSNIDVTDFLTREREDLTKTTVMIEKQKSKKPSRDSSPTKQQEVTTKSKSVKDKTSEDGVDVSTETITMKYPSPRQSPEKIVSQNLPQDSTTKRSDETSERKRISSPAKPSLPIKTEKLEEKYPKISAPVRSSPEKTPEYNKQTTVTSTFDESLTVDDVQRKTKVSTSHPTRILESPTRDTSKLTKHLPEQPAAGQLRSTSPGKQKPKDASPIRKTLSPERKVKSDSPSHPSQLAGNIPDDSQPRESSKNVPSYMKSTTAVTSKFDSHTTENIDVTYVTRTQENEPKTKSSSPTRVTPRTRSPTKPSKPSDSPVRPDTSPERKPAQPAPFKQPQSKHDVPGYMKTTKTATTKTAVLEDVQDTTQSTRTTTVEQKHVSSGSVSPSRKPSQPKTPSERTPSPTKPNRPTEILINKKPGKSQPSLPVTESFTRKPDNKQSSLSSPTKPSSQKIPGYMKTTASTTLKHDEENTEYNITLTENLQENITSSLTDKRYLRESESPSRHTPKSIDRSSPEFVRDSSPSRPPVYDTPKRQESPERNHPSYPKHKDRSPTRRTSPGYMKTTTAMTSKFETTSTSENTESNISQTHTHHKHHSEVNTIESPEDSPRSLSPSKPTNKTLKTSATSPDRKSSPKLPAKDTLPESEHPRRTPGRTSPERPGYMKNTTSITSKLDSTFITHDNKETNILQDKKLTSPLQKKPTSPTRHSPEREYKNVPGFLPKPEEPRQPRTPSPSKKTTTLTESNTDFIMSEREQEIMNKVQKSLRKLSPERKEKSPSRERSPNKTTTSLQDLDIVKSETNQIDMSMDENFTEILEDQITITSKVPRPSQLKDDKPKDQKPSSKPSSRNVSPLKRTPTTPTYHKAPESPTKPRSFSPKKPVSHIDRPQSPQQPKASGIKPREQIPPHLTRKPTPTTLTTTRIERLTTDVKKTNGVTKQNICLKTSPTKTINRSLPSPTGKSNEPDNKRKPTSKQDNVIPKKDGVIRTSSDTAMKPKKTTSPQRMKSKPEIQVSDMSTKSPKSQRPIIKEPHSKLPSKPKSATSLNTSIDEDDIIIDVQQSKSSRENSPDRICPTPINFADDVGVPRFPDEVSEPDDELVKRTHHTIHETETLVDDIVEICEDQELFVKKSDMDTITEHDDSLLSVNDKVNKFTNKINSAKKPKDTTTIFKDKEKRVHSDFTYENLKTDECLLTVSEKVNKFAKGPRDTKDSRSPSRKITDEYDRDTVYTDDYTKLSVNDKAHLFVETAENIKTTKVKPVPKVERPDLSQVDESLKSDDCLLSVSDKVNKFVKTAEQYFTDTQEVEEKETKIKQQHDKVIKQIIDDDDDDVDKEICKTKETVHVRETHTLIGKPNEYPEDNSKFHERNSKPAQVNTKDYGTPKSKPADRVPAVKITTLRSSEAVKKAKALFENIASTQKTTKKETTQTSKTTKLTDIGVIKKSPKTDSTTVLHPSVENVSPRPTDEDIEEDVDYTDRPSSGTLSKPQYSHVDEKPRRSPNRLTAQSPDAHRTKSPSRQTVEVTTTRTVLSRYPAATRAESPRPRTESPRQRTESPRQRLDSDKPDKVPGYLRPTKTSQIKEETKMEEAEVSSRRGSGKFGVELRRTSVERSTVSSERRRSVEHHQPCIEDIFDLDLLEQMLEKVVGYEQRRRIRAQIRVAKTHSEHVIETTTHTKVSKQRTTVPKTRSPERKVANSPERTPKSTSQRTSSPERLNRSTPTTVPDRTQPKEPTLNGHIKETTKTTTVTRQRPQSPEKPFSKTTLAPKTPVRQPSPDKRRTTSPSKVAPKTKGNRFNEYATAYMKKVGLNESDKIKFSDTKRTTDTKQTVKHERQQQTVQEFTTTKSFTERSSSKEVIELAHTNGKRSPSPEKRQSPERKVQFPDHKQQIPDHRVPSPEHRAFSPERRVQEINIQSTERKAYSPERKTHSPERLHQRTPTPDFKRPKSDTVKETVIKTDYDIGKKIPSKPAQEEKPSWVTNRNLKKITSDSRTFSSKKIESEKPKYRAPSPSKVIAKPIDVITSSYGPGPLDADGKPLFGIKALRNGGSNFQVKGTVIRQEFHSRNGGAPEGSVSVTAYSSQPDELQQLLASQGAEPPSRIHGLAAITTTKKFGGDSGNKLSDVHTKEDRASIEQFTHHDRRVEHLESSFDSRSHEFYTDTNIEEITDSSEVEDINRRIESKKEYRQDKTDRSRKDDRVTETKRQKVDERREKMDRRDDKKTVRQSSVKSLTEKYIKSANDSGKSDRSAYPKAGLILRTTSMRDSVSSDDAHPGLQRTDSEQSMCSVDDTEVTTTTEETGTGVRTTTTKTMHHHHHHPHTHSHITHHEPVVTTKKTVITQEPVITTRKTMVVSQEPIVTTKRTTVVTQEPVIQRVTQGRHGTTVTTERSFLDNNTKVTGVQDILTRMKNADIVIQEGDTMEDTEARALLNKFLGATVLMAGMQGYVADQSDGKVTVHQESVRHSGKSSRSVTEIDLDQCWDEALLKKLLDECTDYEQRRRLRVRIRTLMAEQEACASAVTEALGACGADAGTGGDETREEEEVTVTSSVRRDSSDKTVSSSTTTKTSKVIEMTQSAPKPVSPFAKFRQLEKQNSTTSPNSPKTPQSPGSPSQPFFKFTDPALQSSALTIKERLLQWCRDKTRDYENVKLENFSTSWADGLAFCALVHHFLPTAFDYSKLTPDRRRHNFTLAFKVADEKAGIYPLLDVDDMVAMRKPDWKCVFTYVQAIYRRFKDEP